MVTQKSMITPQWYLNMPFRMFVQQMRLMSNLSYILVRNVMSPITRDKLQYEVPLV